MNHKEYRERIARITQQASDPQALEDVIENLIIDVIGENEESELEERELELNYKNDLKAEQKKIVMEE